MADEKKTCEICGGSGQLSFFKGVSRFLLSFEECSACAGTGLQMDDVVGEAEDAKKKKSKQRG